MMPANVAMVHVLKNGIAALVAGGAGGAGKALWDSYFADVDGNLWASQAEIDRWHTHFLARTPTVERGYARSSATWPHVAVPIASERDDKRFVGHLVGHDPDDAEDHFGALEEVVVAVDVHSESLAELDILHLVLKALIRGSIGWLIANTGLDGMELETAADIQPGVYLPETVFVRSQRWRMVGVTSHVVTLGSSAQTVYAHLDAATFDLDGTSTTGLIKPKGEV